MKVIEVTNSAENFAGMYMGSTTGYVITMSGKEWRDVQGGIELLLETFASLKRPPKSELGFLKSDMHVDQTWETLQALRKFHKCAKRKNMIYERYGQASGEVPPVDWVAYYKRKGIVYPPKVEDEKGGVEA